MLQHLVDGLAAKQVAVALSLNEHTTDYVIRCIYRKLHVKCLASAVSIAVNDRLVKSKLR